jgi:DNA-binding LacI/PurR family transcriptional regulator
MTIRRPTSFDIAALAGVSQPTVSRALSGNPSVSVETRERVLAAARELNYTVDKNASGLRRRQSRTIALLFFEDPTPDDTLINPFYLSMVGSLTRACAKKGYDLLISFQQLSGDWHVDYEDSRKADGILLLGYGDYMTARPRLEQLVGQGTHFVRWGAARAGQVGTTVGSDNEQGGYLAGRHLVERGRKAIAFLGTVSDGAPEFVERWTGYERALTEAGLSQDRRLTFDAAPSEEAGRSAALRLLGQGIPFDGIFATSDMVAIGAMRALHDAGLNIPGDVSIVGFDDIAAARLSEPPLTTISQDTRLAGETLVETLIANIEGREPERELLPVRLVVRGSS